MSERPLYSGAIYDARGSALRGEHRHCLVLVFSEHRASLTQFVVFIKSTPPHNCQLIALISNSNLAQVQYTTHEVQPFVASTVTAAHMGILGTTETKVPPLPPTSYTLHPTPYTPHLTPSTLHPTP